MSPRPAHIQEPTNRADLRSSILEFVNEIIYQNGRFLDQYWFEVLAQTQIGAGKRRMCADRRRCARIFGMQYGREDLAAPRGGGATRLQRQPERVITLASTGRVPQLC